MSELKEDVPERYVVVLGCPVSYDTLEKAIKELKVFKSADIYKLVRCIK